MVTPSYRGVLKQVADGLSPEDVAAMTFSLGFSQSKRAAIKNGVQLFQEMENQDFISEDDLSQLKELLDQHDKKKLGKMVGKYMEKKSGKVSGGEEVQPGIQIPNAESSYTKAQQPVPSPGPNMAAYPSGFHSNQYNSYNATSPTSYGGQAIPHQGYPAINNQQQYPSANFPQGPMNPQNMPEIMMRQMPPQSQYFFPQSQPGMNPNMVPNASYHGNQMIPNQYQPSPPPSQQQQFTSQNQQFPKPPMDSRSTQSTELNIPPQAPHTNRLEIQSSEENASDEGEVVIDTQIGMMGKLNLDDSCGSLKSVEPVAKVHGNVQHLQTSHNGTQGGVALTTRTEVAEDDVLVVDAKPINDHRPNISTQPVQPSSATNATIPGTVTPQQPASAIHAIRRVRPSKEYMRWKQDGKKVPIFQVSGYELKIVSQPGQPEHYETGEGRYVLLPWQSTYKIYIGNNTSHRCATEVTYDGKWAGEFELRVGEHMVVERPTIEEKKFCFVKPEAAPSGSGVDANNLDNGIVVANFSPEKAPELNDLKRGGSSGGRLEVDDFSCTYDAEIVDDYEETLVTDAVSFNTPESAGYQHAHDSDVQRSIMGGQSAPSSDWRSGATALVGHSNQQFQPADYFNVDDSKKVEIKLKMVGLK